MKTVAEQWRDFEAKVIPRNAPDIQRSEMRRAFYAGFYSSLISAIDMAIESGDDDDAGAAMMAALEKECLQFADDVGKGRA